MSSTNRSNARQDHIADYYVTPTDEIIKFLGNLDNVTTLDSNQIYLDPCAGGDENNEMSYPYALKEYYRMNDEQIKTVDIREDSLAQTKGDYLTMKLGYKPYCIISNPPFNKALEFIKKALGDVMDGGYVIMLLRLNFLETKARKEFFDQHMPKYIFVHHKRMSFVKGGGTDSVAYAHYVWKKDYNLDYSEIRVI